MSGAALFDILNSNNIYKIRKAEFEAQKIIRTSKNMKESAMVSLKEFTRSLANQQKVQAVEEEYNVGVANLAKGLDTSVNTNMNLVMAAAATQGSLAAQAAALGVGGASVDMIDAVTDLQYEIQTEAANRERDQLEIWGSRGNAQIMDNAYRQLDNSTHFGNFDYTIDMEPTRLKNRVGAFIGIAAASYFGGPQAGAAAADSVMANWKAQDGKYAEASAYWESAGRNAMGAFQEWQALQDDSGKAKSWFAAVRDRNTQAKAAKQQAETRSKENQDTKGFSWGTGPA